MEAPIKEQIKARATVIESHVDAVAKMLHLSAEEMAKRFVLVVQENVEFDKYGAKLVMDFWLEPTSKQKEEKKDE